MKAFLAAMALACVPAVAAAQTSPDGSLPFGLEPYIGVLGGYDSYDRNSDFGLSRTGRNLHSPIAMGVAGVNIPLGPAFIGAEGFGGRGTDAIKWEYGAKGRIGARAGESGMIFLTAGYQWTDVKNNRGFPDRNNWIYGGGFEVGPKDIGLGGVMGASGPRLRFQVDTYDFDSIRPMAGIIWHF